MTKEGYIEKITLIDQQLQLNKERIDQYAGLSRLELGDDEFEKAIKLCNLSVLLMISRTRLCRELEELYGISIL